MAATSVGEIGLDLVVNQNQFEKQMVGIKGTAKKAGMALAAAFSVKKIVDFSKQCLELGSDLAEVQNVVDVTFPSMTSQVDKFAQNAVKNFGLSETMAKRFTGTYGAMAKAFGFSEQQAYDMGTALTGLAGDVASFYNLSQDEAYTKLKSVFTGETESLKDLGVVMTQTALDSYALANGFGKTTSQMSEAEKVALRFQFVSEQLSAAQGDFSRTSDSWANQVRILKLQFDSFKASIGQGLINVFTPVIKVVNLLIGKLVTLANAFKSFTELLTGNKSSGASQISSMGDAATSAGNGMDDAAQSADNMTDSTNKAGNAAKKTAKAMRSLMGFDKINKLDSKTDSSSSTTGSGTPSTDFGSLAQGDTVIDKTDKKMQGLINRCKELESLFKKGFQIGFGDSNKKIDSINASIKNIGKNLKEIFTDPAVVSAANKCADSIALAFGKITGSFARIGLTIADNLIGGVDKYLEKSKDYIKKNLISIFDVTGEIADLSGDFMVAIADIFDVFSSDDAKGITADIIGIFADGYLGAITVSLKFVRDLAKIIVVPVTQNVDKIKTAFENILAPIRIVLDTIHQSVKDTFTKINAVYDEHIAPFFDSISQGISDIVGTLLDGFNTYIAPVLQSLATDFDGTWKDSVQPTLDGILDLLGSVFDLLKVLWENLLQPFINWIAKNIMPLLAPIIKELGSDFLDLLSTVSNVIRGITKVLQGLIDFVTGVLSGNWEKALGGLGEIAEGFQISLGATWDFIKKDIFGKAISHLKNSVVPGWSGSFELLKSTTGELKTKVKNVFSASETYFNDIITFMNNKFLNKWKKSWKDVKDTFSDVFSGLGSLAKKPINAIISAFNVVIKAINSMISRINSIRFSIDVPDWIPGVGGSSWGFNGFNIASVSNIPMLANGAYVKKNTPQLAMIGDNRHQGELVAPENKLREMAEEAVRNASQNAITREDFERIINNAVMRIIAALSNMGFYLDSVQITKAIQAAQSAIDIRYNSVEVK
ncbi:MAG: hypothetical protein ACLT1Q_08175 [Anaerobutyricum soehngenii]